uniref:Uncharacterized protein n=1 Tax=Setaria italica TaxID=4555 RepID=K3XPI5_SETIT
GIPPTSTPTMPSTTTPTQVFKGPITRSRAKELQQEVNALLYEVYLNINENYILPKSSTLLLLSFTKEDDKNTQGNEYKEEPRSNSSNSAKQNRYGTRPVLMHTGQKLNSPHEAKVAV